MASALNVQIEPWGPEPDAVRAAAQAAVGGARLLSAVPVDETRIVALAYDEQAEQALQFELGDGSPVVRPVGRQPAPIPEERDAALGVLHEDPELGPALAEGRLLAYRAMPPTLPGQGEEVSRERALTVGLVGDGRHEIVGVHLGRREVIRFEGGAPPRARAARRRCGLPDAAQPTTIGRAGAARVRITRDGETLWRLIVVRPAASSGTNGSGVELRAVEYRDRRVLTRAHVPILNVRYERDACGPFRDWQNEESRFAVQGSAPAPGFRLCTAPPTTILETSEDRGNFAGVAVFVDGDEVELVSELEAGWYRYISRWRLHADGTIKARFGFGAVRNSCVCTTHHHHVYWRFDFDIREAADDMVLEFNDPPLSGNSSQWHTLRREARRARNPGRKRRWRVRSRNDLPGYVLTPGVDDGRKDRYGVGDLWAVRHRQGELDDGDDLAGTRAQLDGFVTGQPLAGTNLVLWYAAHFSHDVTAHEEPGEHGHIVGPDLTPDRW